MDNIIEATPKYLPLIQKPSCCSCACMQMIILRHGIMPPMQDEIAKKTGVAVSKKDSKCFMEKLRVLKKRHGIRTITKETERTYNKFFALKRLPLRVKAFKVSGIKNHKEFIINNLKNGNDIHVEICLKKITNSTSVHDCVLSKIRYDSKTYVTVIDPWWTYKQFHEIRLETLIDAMSKKWSGRELGFLIYYKK